MYIHRQTILLTVSCVFTPSNCEHDDFVGIANKVKVYKREHGCENVA